MVPCTSCNSICTIPVVFGKPTADLQKAASLGLLELGGCVGDNRSANRKCLSCGQTWHAVELSDALRFISDAVVIVQKHRDAVSGRIADYGTACIDYGRAQRRGEEQASQAFASMLRSHEAISREWEAFFVRAQASCDRFAGGKGRTYGYF